MADVPSQFPLAWPDGWPRTAAHQRRDGRDIFRLGTWQDRSYYTIATASATLRTELERLGARNLVVSSDLKMRVDGSGPLSNQKAPENPGVAIYFSLNGDSMVMARDAFMRVEENIRSLAMAVEAMRQLERHGGGTMLKRAFSGFVALPPPHAITTPAQRAWWLVLGLDGGANPEAIQAAWKARIRTATEAERLEINLARDEGMKING